MDQGTVALASLVIGFFMAAWLFRISIDASAELYGWIVHRLRHRDARVAWCGRCRDEAEWEHWHEDAAYEVAD